MGLTTALALLAAGVLLALAVHGWWSTRRLRDRPAAPAAAQAARAAAGERVEPRLEAAAAPAGDADPVPLPAPARRVPRLDALIDAIVPLTLEAPITGELALAHLPPTRRAGSKPFYIEGLDDETGHWEPFAAGRRYRELQAGVQLASRSGALNEIEYSEFLQKVEAFAEAVGASSDAPDMLDVVARARELDALATPLDAQLTVRLRANGVAWSWSYLQQVAHKLGFVAGAVPGRLVLPGPDEGGPPMLVLAVDAQAALSALDASPRAGAVRECTLMLDVPHTAAAAEPYPAWHRAATQLADDLDATAVDNDGQPLTLHAFAAIGQELVELYDKLQRLDLAAGSPAARRLFV